MMAISSCKVVWGERRCTENALDSCVTVLSYSLGKGYGERTPRGRTRTLMGPNPNVAPANLVNQPNSYDTVFGFWEPGSKILSSLRTC